MCSAFGPSSSRSSQVQPDGAHDPTASRMRLPSGTTCTWVIPFWRATGISSLSGLIAR